MVSSSNVISLEVESYSLHLRSKRPFIYREEELQKASPETLISTKGLKR